MSVPVVQQLFDTPLIEARVDEATIEGAVAAVLALAERETIDVSQPARPRFAWTAQAIEVELVPGEARPLAASPGDFWIALLRIDAGAEPARVAIEDPRSGVLLAGPHGLMHGGDPVIEAIRVAARDLVMFPAYLRHCLHNDGTSPLRCVVVRLCPKRVNS